MSFKNAIRLLCSKFSLVWIRLFAICITGLIVVVLAISPITEMVEWLTEQGFTEQVSVLWNGILAGKGFIPAMQEVLRLINAYFDFFTSNPSVLWGFTLQMGFLVLILFKFVVTTFEMPTQRLEQAHMSDGASLPFLSSYISLLGKSSLYSLVKTLLFFAYDVLIMLALWGVASAISNASFMIPFCLTLVLLLLLTLRSSIFAAWVPMMLIEGRGVFGGLGQSFSFFFRHFAALFSGYFVIWTLIVALCVLMAVFTVGVGLVVTVPICSILLSFFAMTVFYNKSGMRYYLDGKIFDAVEE